jgi:hypothetical protein
MTGACILNKRSRQTRTRGWSLTCSNPSPGGVHARDGGVSRLPDAAGRERPGAGQAHSSRQGGRLLAHTHRKALAKGKLERNNRTRHAHGTPPLRARPSQLSPLFRPPLCASHRAARRDVTLSTLRSRCDVTRCRVVARSSTARARPRRSSAGPPTCARAAGQWWSGCTARWVCSECGCMCGCAVRSAPCGTVHEVGARVGAQCAVIRSAQCFAARSAGRAGWQSGHCN